MNTPKRIPTIVGLFLVIVAVGVVVFFTERAFRSPSGASGSHEPAKTKVTNVSDASFAVSWTTESPATGTVLISTAGKSNKIYYDERDTGGRLGKYTSHLVTIRDALPQTQYSIKILSNGRQFTTGGRSLELTTPATLAPNTNGLEPAYGTIRTPTGSAAVGALVHLTIDQGQELSALTKSTGLWLIPLTRVRTADLASMLPTTERMNETLFITHESGEITATTDSLNDSPVPEMTIGVPYDFRGQNTNKPTTHTLAVATNSVLGATNKPFTVSLDTPKQGAALATSLPLFSGTGIPSKFVSLTIGITQPMSGSTQVKSDGTWSFTPPKTLQNGKQSVTITTVDATGKTVAYTHTFEILKSGTQVLGDATASGTLTQTPTPTSTASTSADESTLSGEAIPTSGNELPTIILLIIGFGLFASGVFAILPIRLL